VRQHCDRHKILVVDDDSFMLGLLVRLLSGAGYDVLAADHGDLAVETAERERLDLVLLDVVLPGVDGYSVCRRIKALAQNASVPVIFLSGLFRFEDKARGVAAGGIDYIVKPFDTKALLSRVRAHTEPQA
jgi:DNA-binding response OmpR family regulator